MAAQAGARQGTRQGAVADGLRVAAAITAAVVMTNAGLAPVPAILVAILVVRGALALVEDLTRRVTT